MQELSGIVAMVGSAFLAAGLVKGVVGMGLPAVAMALLGLMMPPAEAVSLLVVPTIVTNVWQLYAGPRLGAVTRRFATMMVAICAGIPLGIGLLLTGDAHATAALGAVLVAYGAIGLAAPQFAIPDRAERWCSPLIGFVTGAVTGATGVGAIPLAPYLSSLDLDKEEMIQALGLSFTVSMLALAVGLALEGKFHAAVAGGSLLALLPALAGMALGQRIRERMSATVFRRWFFAGLLALGVYMIVRALA
jgi:uncharacterized membrane protein YfcA